MTISEIAKMAGVSSAAISRYLNGGSLSEEKRKKLKKSLKKPGMFLPNMPGLSGQKRVIRLG